MNSIVAFFFFKKFRLSNYLPRKCVILEFNRRLGTHNTMQEAKIEQYPYRTIPHDPLQVREYTLRNGLKLFLSVNTNEPRIYTNIAFRAGSKMDPPETTGLAHYMEHMLFKGSSRIGALDWEKEKAYLDRIADLFEQHRQTADDERRRELYREIDRLSVEAAALTAPNEYDKLAAALGASGTNAYTWLEQTVYVNEIPSNELARWMELEAERFRRLALRLFHTELETVYEEFNISQDRDFRKVGNALRAALFPMHPYGTQTTIGSAEHLRNPSMVNILRFFETYYVPNNMALILAGDFDPDEVVQLAEQHFGALQPRPVPSFTFEEQPPVEGPVRTEVFGQEAPYVQLAWRLKGAQSDDPLLVSLLREILYNEQAGLLDLTLNQQQLVLESEAWAWSYEDYSVFGLYGKPREGQSLEDVERLLLAELDKVRRGAFDDWLLEGVINDLKLDDLEASESNQSRAGAMTNMFILGIDWSRFVDRIRWMSNVSKAELADWVGANLRDDNYVVVYKQQGTDPTITKVDKPPITPIALNRGALSAFAREFLAKPAAPLMPHFANFETDIRSAPLSRGLRLDYVHNRDNSLFRLDYIFEMGKTSDPALPIALMYLPYLGTSRYSAAELQQAFFRLGLTFDVHTGDDRSYITLQGLDEHLEAGIRLFEHFLADVQPDERALQNVIADVLTKREHAKFDRSFILRTALTNFAKYGADSPFRYRLSADQLRALGSAELVDRIRQLTHFEHQIYYYGPRPMEQLAEVVDRLHPTPDLLQPALPPYRFSQLDTSRNEVLFLDFPIVQTDVMLVSKGTPRFSLDEHIMREWYNNYFGHGLSSIVFQEIREAKALAYSTYAYFSSPRRRDQAHYLQAYVGTQPDKLSVALPAMVDIINDMPVVNDQIEHARSSILRQIETERIVPRNLYWAARGVQDLGYRRDLRFDLYQRLSHDGREGLLEFHATHVRNRHFTFLLLGDRRQVDPRVLEALGPLREVTKEEVFGY